MRLSLAQVASAAGCPPCADADSIISGWSIDSRTIQPGDLFIALRGPNHDGHAFLADAFAKGAIAALVDDISQGTGGAGGFACDFHHRLLVVPDTQQALEKLGQWARAHWGRDVVAVTGSAGKTTTKDLIATFLAVDMPVGKNAGNLNNHVGLPLSLLRLPEESRVAVLEIGMNHSGEIASLARIAKPQVGVVTNVGYAHVENFDGIDGVAAAKRELIEALPADGTAVLNADDERVSKFAGAHGGRVITYGVAEAAEVRGEEVHYSLDGVRFRVRGTLIESKLSGRHAVSNLLAGVAVASVYGIEPARLADAARSLEPGAMRGKRFEKNGILHIDDCYNSNPEAARAMIDLLAATPAKRRIAVLGEMLELGRWSEPLHRDLGLSVAKSGLNVLIGIRGAAIHAVESALAAGLPAGAACFFEDPLSAGEWLRHEAREGDAILWKGSRGTHVERALERFLE